MSTGKNLKINLICSMVKEPTARSWVCSAFPLIPYLPTNWANSCKSAVGLALLVPSVLDTESVDSTIFVGAGAASGRPL